MEQKKFNEEFVKVYENPSLITKFDVDDKVHVELDPVYGDAILQAKKVRDQMKDDFKEQDKMVDEFISMYDLEEKPELPKDLDNKDALKDMKLAESMITEEDVKSIKEDLTEDSSVKEIVDYVIKNYKKITGEKLSDVYNKVESEDEPMFDQRVIDKTASSIEDFLIKKGLEDKFDDVMYALDDELASSKARYFKEDLNPNMIYDYIDNYVSMQELGEMSYRWLSSSELTDMLEANGYEDFDDESLYESKSNRLTEAKLSDMLAAFEDKIEELEDMHESLNEDAEGGDVPLADLFDKYDEIMDKVDKNESLEESVNLTEDYSNFLGRPLKDFLNTLPCDVKVNIDYTDPSRNGTTGTMGRVDQVPFDIADRLIKDIQLGDENYYKFKILTEDKKKEITEARKKSKFLDDNDETHRYKIVAADPDDNELFIKDVKGLGKVYSILDDLTDDKLNDMGASQLYITRDDDKELYIKANDEEGVWSVDYDVLDMEKPAEERDTVYNHIMADLNAESTPDQKALRNLSREGQGYVGFEDDEIGYDEVEGRIKLKSRSDKPISWAKKVAEYYGYNTTEVELGSDGYKHIEIMAPDLVDEDKLNP